MSDSEPPMSESGPPPGGTMWIEPMQGDLVVIDGGRATDWKPVERGMRPELKETPV